MTTSRPVEGKSRSVRDLLAGRKYAIDYYQREYRWQRVQLEELLDDLAERFKASHVEGNPRSAVRDYSHYFLGSVILSERDGDRYIIDGQQRLTTLTLLLMYLRRHLTDDDQRAQVAELIFSLSMGERSFNLDVPERRVAMEALYEGAEYEADDASVSVENILERYGDLEDLVPGHLEEAELPYFSDWLVENVHLIEITAYTDDDAYLIFETMNDRGLSLTAADMLRGYLLANIEDAAHRKEAGEVWRKRMKTLEKDLKDDHADSIKSWLRAQHAQTTRERKRDARPMDFDRIGTEFHRWVRENEGLLGLQRSDDFTRFIRRDFAFYTDWYGRMRRAAARRTDGLEAIHSNGQYAFTLQYPAMLAPLRTEDSEATCLLKIRLVATFLDIWIHRRIWNWKVISYSTVQYGLFTMIKAIRGLGVEELLEKLQGFLDEAEGPEVPPAEFGLHMRNGRWVHRILARLTDHVQVGSGLPSNFVELTATGKHRYEVEHIWANHFERHTDEFEHDHEFRRVRDRLGDLLLLPKRFNASYGDLPYGEKRELYVRHNLLAMSLHEQAYDHNPGFARFIGDSGLPFRPMPEFRTQDLEERQALYQQIAARVWDRAQLESMVSGPVAEEG